VELSGLSAGFAGIGVFQALVALYHLLLALEEMIGVVVVGVVVVVDVVDGVDVVLRRLSVDRAGAITGVGSDVATVEPFLFVAVTAMRKVDLTSVAITRCCWPVAPMMGAQSEPALSQRIHWNS